MEIREKTDILDVELMNLQSFDDDSKYMVGFFSDSTLLLNNNDFLRIYRYIQCWKLDIPSNMDNYFSEKNYSYTSLIENMKLTGIDEYFNHFMELPPVNKNIKYSSNDGINKESENIFTELALHNRSDLVEEYYSEGFTPHDIYIEINNANSALVIIKKLVDEGYIPSDDIIIWYIERGMGCLVKECITTCTDMNFVLDFYPRDLDTLNLIIDKKFQGLLRPEDAQKYIFSLVDSDCQIDVALFIILYQRAKDSISRADLFRLLVSIIKKEQSMLTFAFLKILNEDGLSLRQLEILIFDDIRNAHAYIIFKIHIEKDTNYEEIMDFVADLVDIPLDNFNSSYDEDYNSCTSSKSSTPSNSCSVCGNFSEENESEDEEKEELY